MNISKKSLPNFAFALLLTFSASSAGALDNPHNPLYTHPVSCSSCHQSGDTSWWEEQESNVCGGTCHNAAVLGEVKTHRNESGDIVVQCTKCHNPHEQRQDRRWGGTTSALYTGTSDAVTSSTLKKAGANWTARQWQGELLLPDVRYPAFIYKIEDNTADTITIVTSGGDGINTSFCFAGATFAVVHGKFVKDIVNNSYVKFFRETGTNSFADNDAMIDGICQVCHDKTTSFNAAGTLEGPGHPASEAGTNCTSCHTHKGGFKPNCKDCHGYPPVADTQGGPDGLAKGDATDTGTGSTSAGAHSKHAVSLGYACETCHTNGMPASTVYDKQIEIGFSIAGGAYQTGTYNGRSSLINNYTYSAGNAGTTVTQDTSKTPMQCSNIYCHGSTIASAGTTQTPVWNDASTGACGTCHGISSAINANNYPTRGSHTRHTGPTTGNIGYGFGCQTCHNTTTSDGTTITDQSKHVNNAADWAFDGSDSRVSSAQYRSASSGAVSNPPSSSYGSCSTVYCHSKGQSDTGDKLSLADYASPQWGVASTGQCGTCHNVDAGSNPPTSGSHTKHAGATASGGYAFVCTTCHYGFSEISSTHVDGKLNVTIDSQYGSSAASSADGQNVQQGFSSSTCSSVYCHSIVQTSTGDALSAGNTDHYKTPTWGTGSLTCSSCHGYPSDSGSHLKHAGGDSNSGQYSFTCDRCHSGYVPPVTTGTHVNGAINVATDPTASGSYNGDSTPGNGFSNCSNTYCHSNGTSVATGIISSNTTSVWGTAGPLACNSCHGNTYYAETKLQAMPDYDNDNPKANRHTFHLFDCNYCHHATTTDGTTITNQAKHANGVYDLEPDPSSTYSGTNVKFTYTFDIGGGTCSNISCHIANGWGSGQFTWGIQYYANISAVSSATTCYQIQFSASFPPGYGETPPYTYDWQFGDGGTSTADSPTHTYPNGNTYTVTLNVKDANRHPATATTTVTPLQLNSSPTGSYTVSVVGDTVTLTDLSTDTDYNSCGHSGSGTVKVQWSNTASDSDTKSVYLTDSPSYQTFTHTYSVGGTYTIRYYVTDNAGAQVQANSTSVTIVKYYSISGTVTDGTGAALPGATIYLKMGTTTKKTTTTSSDGTYSFGSLSSATYTVVPSITGRTFSPSAATVSVGPSATNINFTSTP